MDHETIFDSSGNAPEVKPQSLFRHADFMKLWTGETISEFGSKVGGVAVSFLAVIALHATPAQMAALAVWRTVPALLFSLFAGVWVDRLRRRPLMIWRRPREYRPARLDTHGGGVRETSHRAGLPGDVSHLVRRHSFQRRLPRVSADAGGTRRDHASQQHSVRDGSGRRGRRIRPRGVAGAMAHGADCDRGGFGVVRILGDFSAPHQQARRRADAAQGFACGARHSRWRAMHPR